MYQVVVHYILKFVTVELFHKDAGEENNDLSEDDLSEDLPVDEGVAEVIGGLLSKVHSAPSHKFEAVVHLRMIIARIVLQWGWICSG